MSNEPFNPGCPKCFDQHPVVVKSADGKKTYARCRCGKSEVATDHPLASIRKAWNEELTRDDKEKEFLRRSCKKTRRSRFLSGD